jgi:hypothetical protein
MLAVVSRHRKGRENLIRALMYMRH